MGNTNACAAACKHQTVDVCPIAQQSGVGFVELKPEDIALQRQQPGKTQMTLKVIAIAREDNCCGSRRLPFKEGEEVSVLRLEKVLHGWDPLQLRQERCVMDKTVAWSTYENPGEPPRLPWPRIPRVEMQQRFWRAKVVSTSGGKEQWCTLQVAALPRDRREDVMEEVLDDVRETAAHAHSFNTFMRSANGGDPVPGIKVCAPVGVEVTSSLLPQIVNTGDSALLVPWNFAEVRKFMFDGSEEFMELPHTFFHYAAFQSQGAQQLFDMQGAEQDDDVLLFDPVVLRTSFPGLRALMGHDSELERKANTPTLERFAIMHPRCGQICKAFDPQRRGAAQRREQCGLSCGV